MALAVVAPRRGEGACAINPSQPNQSVVGDGFMGTGAMVVPWFPHTAPAAGPPQLTHRYANMNLIDQELNSSKNHFMAFFVIIAMNPDFIWLFFFFFAQANATKQQNKHFSPPETQLSVHVV